MQLRASNDELSDLAEGAPELVDVEVGVHTGVRLSKRLGVGGMASVFLADRDLGHPSSLFSPFTPQRFAVKVMQPSTVRQIAKMGGDPLDTFRKEVVALGKLSERSPPTPFVISFYGCGMSDVVVRGATYRLPWLAIEYVDGGVAGTSLTERIEQTRGGIDPIRALRLVKGLGAGVRALHDAGIIHRDLKPDNVLVAGPIDDEVPKLSDCGIARVDGLATGLAAATRAYCGGEQMISIGGSPLIGPWTDVHALAAVIWFVLAGEQWCVDNRWFAGERRSLRTAAHLHPGFLADPILLAGLDAVIARGAAPGIPAGPLASPRAASFVTLCQAAFPLVLSEPRRFASVDAFYQELLPLLERLASQWRARAAKDHKAATAYRPTAHVQKPSTPRTEIVRDLPPKPLRPFDPREPSLALLPGRLGFQPDGKVLAASRTRVVFFIDGQPYLATSPAGIGADEHRAQLAQVDRVHYVGELGYALVSKRSILLLRAGQWTRLSPPSHPDRTVGPITASLAHRGRLVVVTAETDDGDGGVEVWSTSDGARWEGPITVPLGGDAHAIAEGPYGTVLVGAQGRRGRAAFLAPDSMVNVYALGKVSPLQMVVHGAERESWGASDSAQIVRFDRSVAEIEATLPEPAVALALDLVGVPWVLTATTVFRRELEAGKPQFRALETRIPGRPPFVGLGFTPQGAHVLDAEGGFTHLEPSDVEHWRK
jgi:eukaryotic-like serine/threonine-protein kinase